MSKTLIALIFLLPLAAQGQQSLEFFNIDVEEGLSNRNVRFTTRDHQGFLWIVNSQIERFDGHHFKRYSHFDPDQYLPIANLTSAISLGDTALLATNGREFMTFNFASEKAKTVSPFKNFTTDSFLVDKIYRPQNSPYILVAMTNQGNSKVQIYDSTYTLTSEYETSRNQFMMLEPNSYFTMSDKGVLYHVSSADNKLHIIKGTEKETISIKGIDLYRYLDKKIIYHPTRGLMFCTSKGKVFAQDQDDKFQLVLDYQNDFRTIKNVFIDQKGIIKMYYRDGVVNVNLKNNTYHKHRLNLFEGKNPHILHISEDHEGITWISSETGLIKVQPRLNPFTAHVSAAEGERNIQYREIFRLDSNSLIVRLTDETNHLVKFTFKSDGLVDTTHISDRIFGVGIGHLYDKNFIIAYGKVKEILLFDLGNGDLISIDLPFTTSPNFRNLSYLEEDTFHYVTDENDIVRFNLKDKTFDYLKIENDLLSRSFFSKFLLKTKDNQYINGGAYGLLIHDSQTGALQFQVTRDRFPDLASHYFNCITGGENDIYWTGTLGGGICKIDIKNKSIKTYTSQHGLPDNMVASIELDRQGYLWIGTYNGLARFDPKIEEFHVFTEEDGLPHNEFNFLSSLYTEDGELYMGTFNGLLKFRPDQIFSDRELPPVVITSIASYDRKLDTTIMVNGANEDIKKIRLRPTENYLDINFAVPSYIGIGNYSYEMKLSEIDNDWQQIGDNPSIRYQKLPDGEYEFQVRAKDSKGRATSVPTSLSIVVQQPFYESSWFWVSLSLLAALLFYLLYRYRVQLIRKESETRARIASDLHDEIGSSMTRISMQLQLLEPSLTGEHKSVIQKLSGVVDQSILKVRDLVWSIDMTSDTWQDMIDRMKDYAYDTLGPRNIHFHLESSRVNMKKVLKPLVKRNLYLVFKEAINNVAKHSTGDQVHVQIGNEDEGFRMSISDNGISANGMREGKGMYTMKMRSERMGGRLRVLKEEAGFKVRVELSKVL